MQENGILHAAGEKVVDGNGNEIMLRGVNAGGMFVTENWMNGFRGEVSDDYRTATTILVERFGKDKTKAIWKNYRENWWSEADFQNCADMGMTVIRLPFTYMNVDFDATLDLDMGGRNYDFSALDEFVAKAAAHGIYTILDLHGAYGSQNGQDHSGETLSRQEVDFYSNEQKISLTEKLWSALAEHYKDNAAVAGYDIINEPGEKAEQTFERHWAIYDRLYDAIRKKDTAHMVIFESCWDGRNLPHPEAYGWENCMYSFHHYTNETNNFYNHCSSFNAKLEDITSQNFGVPLQMGEFTCYNRADQWDYTLNLLNNAGFHWCTWTYKLNSTSPSPWGILYKVTPWENKVNVAEDSYETILNKFSFLKTNDKTEKTYFQDGDVTLETIIGDYCRQDVSGRPDDGTYIFRDNEVNGVLKTGQADGNAVVCLGKVDEGKKFTLTYCANKDGSVNISSGDAFWCVFSQNGKDYVGLSTAGNRNEMKFYPEQTKYGTQFISYSTCRYLYIDEEGNLRADGTSDQAHAFVCTR